MEVSKYCSKCNIFRLGGEFNIFNDISLRGGYNLYMYDIPYEFVSCGIGKRVSQNSSFDLAFRTRLKDSYNSKPYDDYAFDDAGEAACIAPQALINNRAYDLMLTYRVKF